MLTKPFRLNCEITEAQISHDYDADDDEDSEIEDCDIYEDPICVEA